MPSTANNGNYIKLFRKFKKWGWYSDPCTKSVFIHLLLSANWEDGEFLGEKVKTGQCVFGRKKAAQELGLSEQNVRTAIKHLTKSGEISTVKVTNKFSIINIEKWGLYQGQEETPNRQANQTLTKHQPSTNHFQEEKEEKEEKEVYMSNTSTGSKKETISSGFEAKAIISYLNDETGRQFKAGDRRTNELIADRLREGYQVSDFLTVIDNKVRQWLGDEKMEEFLTPRTLFSADHFADYLAQTPTKKEAGKQKKSPFDTLLGRIRRGDSPARLTEEEDRQISLGLYNELCRKQSSMTDDEIRTAIAKGGID